MRSGFASIKGTTVGSMLHYDVVQICQVLSVHPRTKQKGSASHGLFEERKGGICGELQ